MPSTPVRRIRADAQRNREAIIAAARSTYAELGPDAPFDAIAKRAGVANATLYRHFANAEELREAIFATRLHEAADKLTALALEPDAGGALGAYLHWLAASPDASLVDLLGRIDGFDSLHSERMSVRQQTSALLERAIEFGAVRADLTLADLAVIMLALARVGLTDWVLPVQRERFIEIVLSGLRP